MQDQPKSAPPRQSKMNDSNNQKNYKSSSNNVQQLTSKYTMGVKCEKPHFVAACPDYQKLSPEDRFETIQKNNLCTNCLSNHIVEIIVPPRNVVKFAMVSSLQVFNACFGMATSYYAVLYTLIATHAYTFHMLMFRLARTRNSIILCVLVDSSL